MERNWKLESEEDDLDEPVEQNKDEYIVSDDGDDLAFEDSWETEANHIPDIHLKRLDEIIRVGYPGDPHDKTRTGGVLCPKALDLAWRAIKREGGRWTKARVQRISVYHGLRMAFKDDDIKAINRAYNKLMTLSKNMDDDDLINALAERRVFSFRDPSPKTTSMGTLVFLEGAIADLADSLGIAKSNMYPLLSLMSIVTYQPPMWEMNLGKEYRSFRNALGERLAKLEKEYKRVVSGENEQKNSKTEEQQDGRMDKQ